MKAKTKGDAAEPESPQKKPASKIEENRKCQDILFLLLFIAFWVGMIAVAATAIKEGNVKRIIYGLDYQGNLCGDSNNGTNGPDFRHRTKLYWTGFNNAFAGDLSAVKAVCLEECKTDYCDMGLCTSTDQLVCLYDDAYNTDYASVRDLLGILDPLYDGPCSPALFATTSIVNKCFPTVPDFLTEIVQDLPDNNNYTNPNSTLGQAVRYKTAVATLKDAFTKERMQRYMADLYKGWMIIVGAGLIGSMIISLLYMGALRFFAGLLCWLVLIGINLLFIMLTIFCYMKGGTIKHNQLADEYGVTLPSAFDPSVEDRDTFVKLAYAMTAFSVLLLLLTIAIASRVRVAVGVIKVASQAVGSMPQILFLPLFPFGLNVLLVLYWVFIGALLYSAGDVVKDKELESYELVWRNELRYMFLYHVFGLLWSHQFIVGLSHTITAGAVASYYWCRGDMDGVGSPVTSSVWRTIRYHLGSVAFGAFILAIIQFVRLIIEYLDRKSKAAQNNSPLLKHIMYCIRYFLWYVEQVMKFINRNTYIIIAVKGTSYCQSAQRAVKLLVGNVLRVAAVNVVGDLLLFLGKIAIASACGCIAFKLCDMDRYSNPGRDTYLSSPLFPILATFLIAYFVASIFLQTYEMTIDTILLCFCEDCEQTDGNPQYAPPLLMDAIGKARQAQNKGTVAPTTSGEAKQTPTK